MPHATPLLRLPLALVLGLLAGLGGARAQTAIAVTTTADEFDATPNATCSLREAVRTANTAADFGGCAAVGTGTPYTIGLPPGTYTLAIAGAAEDAAASGDLDVLTTIVIQKSGTDPATIDGADLDRVFDVHPGTALTLEDVVVRNGHAALDSGGGIRVLTGSLALVRVVLEANDADVNGGGIFADEGVTISITDSEIRNNNADADANSSASRGGGLYIADPSAGTNTVLIERTTIAGNFGDAFGGAISTLGTTDTVVTILNSTISGNTSVSSGGGISSGGPLTLDGVTITANTSNTEATFSGGGGIRRVNGTVTMRNTIVAANDATLNTCDDLSGTASGFVSQGGNLIGENTCLEAAFAAGAPNAAGDYVGTDPTPIDPMLGPLADNGGLTRTHALLAGSLAIDHGNTTLPVDQRGVTRDATPDIGSYEFVLPVAAEPGPGATHTLSAVAPSPAAGSARFTLALAGAQRVEVALFDVTGRRVALLHDGVLAAGAPHAFTIEGAALPAGAYVLRVLGEHFAESRRVVFVR